MSVRGCLAINWVAELEPLLYGIWTEVEDVAVRGVGGVVLVCHNALCDFCIGECDMRGSEGVDIDAHGVGFADCICDLNQHTVGDACSDEVLGYVPGGISGRAVYLGGVFAREGAAAVSAVSAVGVDNDFTACEACVTCRTANDEFACRIDMEDIIMRE